jgi:acetoin utilization deacetylase AcuC-like enzyme
MAAAPVFISHPTSLEHDTGDHPERKERLVAIARELERRDWLGWARASAPDVELDVLSAVHPLEYVESIQRACLMGGGWLDADTLLSERSYVAALHSAGGAVAMVDGLVAGGVGSRAFTACRPPGHHAIPSRAMGFCLFNNIAVAARYAIDRLGRSRVMILDWDVHHGNGTNDIFASTPEVLFVSIHQSPLYPGTGAASDVGSGPGRGFNVNLPVPAGSGDRVYLSLVADVAVPLARAFAPELVLISAGFDAHADDPLAGCAVTEAGFAGMAGLMSAVCDSIGAPLGCVLEGGYALGALARSVAATMEALVGPVHAGGSAEPSGGEPVPVALAWDARARLAEFWPELAQA